MSNWKAAGPDYVQGFWFNKATSLNPKLKQHMQECVCWISTYMDDRIMHSTHHERQTQRDSFRKLWIDYRKAYDVVLYSWIFKCARMVGAAQNMVTLIKIDKN